MQSITEFVCVSRPMRWVFALSVLAVGVLVFYTGTLHSQGHMPAIIQMRRPQPLLLPKELANVESSAPEVLRYGFCAWCDKSHELPPSERCPVLEQRPVAQEVQALTQWAGPWNRWRHHHEVIADPAKRSKQGSTSEVKYLSSRALNDSIMPGWGSLRDLTASWRLRQESIFENKTLGYGADNLPYDKVPEFLKAHLDSPGDDLMKQYTLNGYYRIARRIKFEMNVGTAKEKAKKDWLSLVEMFNSKEAEVDPSVPEPHKTYGDDTAKWLSRLVRDEYPVRGKKVLVLGSEYPWVEYELLAAGADHVTTVEYTETPIPSAHPRMRWAHPTSMGGEVGAYDVAVTFSSVEHPGLGRYGDPIDPHGDLRELAKISCLLAPGGLLLLGVPVGADCMMMNLHRMYGPLRLQLMTECFRAINVASVKWADCQADHDAHAYDTYQPWMVFQNQRGCGI